MKPLLPLSVSSSCLSNSLEHQPSERDSLWEFSVSFSLEVTDQSWPFPWDWGRSPLHSLVFNGWVLYVHTYSRYFRNQDACQLPCVCKGIWFWQLSVPIPHYLGESVPILGLPGYWKRPLKSLSRKVVKWQLMLHEADHQPLFNPNSVWNNFDLVANI